MEISAYINRERLVNTFLELIGINSPSFEEAEIGKVLVRRLSEAGCETEIQEYGKSFNVLAFKRGSVREAPSLLLNAHMDTIEPTTGIDFVLENETIRSTGNTVLGADDKSALAQILEALTVLHERELPHGDLEIAFTSGEERGLAGAHNLDFGKLKSRFALVPDSGGKVGKIVTAAPTHLTYEMRITGRPAHAGIEPEKGINAVRVAARIIGSVPDGRIDPLTTANIGMIRGGTATNVVAKEVVINGEIRGHDNNRLAEIRKVIFDTAAAETAKAGALLNVSEEEEYTAFRINEDDAFLRFLAGVYKKCGLEPEFTVTGGGSDANVFNSRGLKALNISNGMRNVHSHEEFIALDDLFKGCLVVLAAATQFHRFK